MKPLNKNIRQVIIVVVGLIVLNIVAAYIYKRFDLTQDQRYTLSEAAKESIASVNSPLEIDIYLQGNFPAEFKRLQAETRQLLEEFSAYNGNLQFNFISPDSESGISGEIGKNIQQYNLVPAQVEVRENGRVSSELVYPWALAYYNGKTERISLLKNQLGTTPEERVNNSIQNLEYAFADAFKKLVSEKRKKVAVLKGNGELEDRYVADYFKTLKDYYFIAPFTLDSAEVAPQKTLEQLSAFDLVVVASPTEAFSDSEKYILDQYTMRGKSSLWLIDNLQFQQDTTTGKMFAFGRDLQLGDLFFKYGLRINFDLVKDLYSAPIVLASGNEQDSQYSRYPWFYFPLSASANNHPIVTNIEGVKFEYASSIDVLENDINKTILLSTSPITQLVGLPHEINYDLTIPENLEIINSGPNPNQFKDGEKPLAVLLEGKFTSAFKNRVKPFKLKNSLDESGKAKMVVISDGDIIKNQFDKNRPLETGFDKMTQTMYGNKDFSLNTANYLLDDSGLINIRTKKVAIPFLDPQKIQEQRTKWQVVNILLPLVLLGIFGVIFQYLRKRRYTR